MTNKNKELESDINTKITEINVTNKTNKLLEQELFYGINVSIKEKEDAIN